MARIKVAYVGGGSTRAVGTMASWIQQGENFAGSEIVLVDVDDTHLDLVRTIARRMAQVRGVDLTLTATTDRVAALDGCDAVLTSFRPGGFQARAVDERLPLRHDVIGQETQGPGGFFMALRSIHATRAILADMATVCPHARIFNYTNPVNIVAQAVADHTEIPIVALCEGPIVYPQLLAQSIGLDPTQLDVASIGLNHGSWSVRHSYASEPLIPILQRAWDERRDDGAFNPSLRRMLRITATMGAIPSGYFQYYYFEHEILAELQRKPTTRAEDILAEVPDYWEHYAEQADADQPRLDPRRSRGGIHELELAIDCMDAIYNDRNDVMPVNVPNHGSVPGLPDTLVVETVGRCNATGVHAERMPALPVHVMGLVESLGYYQQAAADAAWDGNHRDAVRALASHPLVRSLDVAESLYGEMAHAHRDYLPDRLLPT